MLSKSFIIPLFLIFSQHAYAEDEIEQSQYTHLEAGEAAPFSGTLFNAPALSQILVESQYSFDECDLRIEFEKNLIAADYQLRLDTLQAGYDSLSERHDLLMTIKNDEIETYRSMALEKPNKNNQWWLAGGVVAGVVITVSAAWAMGQVSSMSAN